MKRLPIFLAICATSLSLLAQNPDGSYNPYVNSGIITPSPLLPSQMNGSGVISFNFGNSGGDQLEIFDGHAITLIITLSGGVPDHTDPVAALSGTAAGLFSWTFSGGTYTGTQVTTVNSGFVGPINIAYKVTQNSTPGGSNGFNVNITPAPYQNTSNTPDDDAVSSYTYTEYRDYGDAPSSYGSVSHNIDFQNYLGAAIDGEDAHLVSSAANGDDNDGVDDEDGVLFPAEIIRGATINIPVTVRGLGYLSAWIDWNGNGSFEDSGERVADNVGRGAGTVDLSIDVPEDAVILAPTFARFRLNGNLLTSSTGSTEGGEVEDYQLTIQCLPPTVNAGLALSDICQGETTTELNGSIGGSATGGIWSSAEGGVFSPNAGTLTATWTPPAAFSGTATLVLTTVGGNCGEVTSEVLQQVNSTPLLNITDPDPVCLPGVADLTAATVTFGSTPGLSYTFWADAGGTLTLDNPETAPPGIYYIRGTSAAGCSDLQPVTVTSNPVVDAPQVSNTAPENVCPNDFINIELLVTSETPSGGLLYYKTSNNPLGINVTDPSAVGSGSYYVFYQSQEGCFSTGTEVVVIINSCPPDVTPTVTASPNVMNGLTEFNLIVHVTELNFMDTGDPITINIPKDSRWFLTNGFDPSLTLLEGTVLDNNHWTYREDAVNHIFETLSVIPSGGALTFGFVITFDPGNTRGTYTITTQIESGGGGEERVNNNVDSEKLDYFQEL